MRSCRSHGRRLHTARTELTVSIFLVYISKDKSWRGVYDSVQMGDAAVGKRTSNSESISPALAAGEARPGSSG